ncbi:MAG: hypothetical protein U0X75_24215 [Acidobacteriota bacterium]
MSKPAYNGTRGVNLERIDDINRFAGDLLDGREDRINPNFGTLLFVTNGVDSQYHAATLEVRRNLSKQFSVQANYRWSKWLDTSSDTSTGQLQTIPNRAKARRILTACVVNAGVRCSIFRTGFLRSCCGRQHLASAIVGRGRW